MFEKKLRELRGQPYERKLKVLWSGVAVIAVLVIGLWALSLQYRDMGKSDVGEKFSPIWQNLKKIQKAIF